MCTADCGPSVEGTHKRRCTEMQTKGSIRLAAAVVLAVSAIFLAACSGAGSDKAGGADAARADHGGSEQCAGAGGRLRG
jgi:hypothetical protein